MAIDPMQMQGQQNGIDPNMFAQFQQQQPQQQQQPKQQQQQPEIQLTLDTFQDI